VITIASRCAIIVYVAISNNIALSLSFFHARARSSSATRLYKYKFPCRRVSGSSLRRRSVTAENEFSTPARFRRNLPWRAFQIEAIEIFPPETYKRRRTSTRYRQRDSENRCFPSCLFRDVYIIFFHFPSSILKLLSFFGKINETRRLCRDRSFAGARTVNLQQATMVHVYSLVCISLVCISAIHCLFLSVV